MGQVREQPEARSGRERLTKVHQKPNKWRAKKALVSTVDLKEETGSNGYWEKKRK